jgi:phytoene desaturase
MKAVVIGSGLGGLATALRLACQGFEVEIIEKHHSPGGRLNVLQKDGFTFDVGPSFFSMSFEFEELFRSCGLENPIQLNELNPLYAVYFENRQKPFLIYKDLVKLQQEFENIEDNLISKVENYLKGAGRLFHDTENLIIRRNFMTKADYLLSLMKVPLRHSPKLFRSMWSELERHFQSEELKIIFSLVAFFLGSTPFQTPAVYQLLNYTELKHDGYWNVKGGMYKIVEKILELLQSKNVSITLNTEIIGFEYAGNKLVAVTDSHQKKYVADVFISNSDAAAFRGQILKRPKFTPHKLDKMDWTLAPFTIYLGVKGKCENLHHHNYFLGNNFKQYSDVIFKSSVSPVKPYYYVNVSSKSNPECAPPGCENLFILCPVPDLRFKPDWSDTHKLASSIIADLSNRIQFDLEANTLSKTIMNPVDWQNAFNLYRGSGLGLAHGLNQVGGLRPSNKDEQFNNLYYVGASTLPGTGLPMVVISSKLVTERILNDFMPSLV